MDRVSRPNTVRVNERYRPTTPPDYAIARMDTIATSDYAISRAINTQGGRMVIGPGVQFTLAEGTEAIFDTDTRLLRIVNSRR